MRAAEANYYRALGLGFGVEVKHIDEHQGKGCFAVSSFEERAVVFRDCSLACLQSRKQTALREGTAIPSSLSSVSQACDTATEVQPLPPPFGPKAAGCCAEYPRPVATCEHCHRCAAALASASLQPIGDPVCVWFGVSVVQVCRVPLAAAGALELRGGGNAARGRCWCSAGPPPSQRQLCPPGHLCRGGRPHFHRAHPPGEYQARFFVPPPMYCSHPPLPMSGTRWFLVAVLQPALSLGGSIARIAAQGTSIHPPPFMRPFSKCKCVCRVFVVCRVCFPDACLLLSAQTGPPAAVLQLFKQHADATGNRFFILAAVFIYAIVNRLKRCVSCRVCRVCVSYVRRGCPSFHVTRHLNVFNINIYKKPHSSIPLTFVLQQWRRP
jgi:hypothetical protein